MVATYQQQSVHTIQNPYLFYIQAKHAKSHLNHIQILISSAFTFTLTSAVEDRFNDVASALAPVLTNAGCTSEGWRLERIIQQIETQLNTAKICSYDSSSLMKLSLYKRSSEAGFIIYKRVQIKPCSPSSSVFPSFFPSRISYLDDSFAWCVTLPSSVGSAGVHESVPSTVPFAASSTHQRPVCLIKSCTVSSRLQSSSCSLCASGMDSPINWIPGRWDMFQTVSVRNKGKEDRDSLAHGANMKTSFEPNEHRWTWMNYHNGSSYDILCNLM